MITCRIIQSSISRNIVCHEKRGSLLHIDLKWIFLSKLLSRKYIRYNNRNRNSSVDLSCNTIAQVHLSFVFSLIYTRRIHALNKSKGKHGQSDHFWCNHAVQMRYENIVSMIKYS